MSNTTCSPGNTLPELGTLPIPHNVTVAVIPGSNISDAAMQACCTPNPLHIALGCYEWCEVPGSRLNSSQVDFTTCLGAQWRNTSQSNIIGISSPSAAGRSAVTATGLGIWMLLVSSILNFTL